MIRFVPPSRALSRFRPEPAAPGASDRPGPGPLHRSAHGPRRRSSVPPSPADERGDVPGWVLVTLMTAGLVVSLWAVAGPALTQVFTDAIAKVTGAI